METLRQLGEESLEEGTRRSKDNPRTEKLKEMFKPEDKKHLPGLEMASCEALAAE